MQLAETLAAYERGEINVLINAMLLAEGWNSPRATVCMHLAPTASRRVYQQRIGRIMRMHPRKEAGVVVDFVPKGATHNERVVSLHSLLDADFYREGARVTPAPRRRVQRRARRKLSPAPWLVPVTPDVKRRLAVIDREWQRIDPRFLDDDEQLYWATIAGRAVRFDERVEFVKKFTEGKASRGALEQFLTACAAENPNRRLRMTALADRVSMTVERASFDDLVTLVTQAPTWEKDRVQGVRTLLRAIGDGKADAPEQILARWTWRLARATRKVQDRRASAEFPEAKRLLGALANSRGHRHEENAAKLVNAALDQPREVGAALLASAEGYTPRANQLIDAAREQLGTIQEVANALADNLPAPKAAGGRSRRRRRKRKKKGQAPAAGASSSSSRRTAPQAGKADKPEQENRPGRRGVTPRLQPRLQLIAHGRALPSCSAIAFARGIVTAVSPCVFPVLPILFAGGASGGRRRPLRDHRRARRQLRDLHAVRDAGCCDQLHLPQDFLRNLSIALLFLVAATLIFPQLRRVVLERPLAPPQPPRPEQRPRRRLPARREPRARLRALRRAGARRDLGQRRDASTWAGRRSRSRSPTRSARRFRCSRVALGGQRAHAGAPA